MAFDCTVRIQKHFVSDIIFMDTITMNFDNPIFVKVSQIHSYKRTPDIHTLTHYTNEFTLRTYFADYTVNYMRLMDV